ncbi:MAG TPA: hypothetical protein PKJ97_00840 [Candidatus Bilamarchaeaceae archaeon]|nr:hypothetical protein [Candidatus Bilamarchaeaceae archaeon]
MDRQLSFSCAGNAQGPARLEQEMRSAREDRRRQFRKTAFPITRSRLFGKCGPGEIITGRNREGKPVRTLVLDKFKIDGRDPKDVRISFNRESRDFQEGEKVPRKQQVGSYDIFGAVRVFSTHIPATYKKELEVIDRNIRTLESINSRLTFLISKEADPESVRAARDELEWMSYTMGAAASAYRDLANRKLVQANALLERAETEASNRPRLISNACATLTAVRNRESWRDRQRERIISYEYFRECSMRIRRDRHVQKVLANHADWLTGPEAGEEARRVLSGNSFARPLAVIRDLVDLERGDWRAYAKECIKSLGEGMGEGAEKRSLRGIYRQASRLNKKDFLCMLKRATRPYIVNDPGLIADELEESSELYLQSIIEAIREGFVCMQAGNLRLAANNFRQAVSLLR